MLVICDGGGMAKKYGGWDGKNYFGVGMVKNFRGWGGKKLGWMAKNVGGRW